MADWEGIPFDEPVADVDLDGRSVRKVYPFHLCLKYAQENPEVCERHGCIIHKLIKALVERGAVLPCLKNSTT